MKFIAEKLEKIAEKKIERKAKAAASVVDISRNIRGENPNRYNIPIGLRPLGLTPQNYAAAVGSRAVAKLNTLGVEDIAYDAAATEEASLKMSPGMHTYDVEGRVLMPGTITPLPDKMMGYLTLVLVNEAEQFSRCGRPGLEA